MLFTVWPLTTKILPCSVAEWEYNGNKNTWNYLQRPNFIPRVLSYTFSPWKRSALSLSWSRWPILPKCNEQEDLKEGSIFPRRAVWAPSEQLPLSQAPGSSSPPAMEFHTFVALQHSREFSLLWGPVLVEILVLIPPLLPLSYRYSEPPTYLVLVDHGAVILFSDDW